MMEKQQNKRSEESNHWSINEYRLILGYLKQLHLKVLGKARKENFHHCKECSKQLKESEAYQCRKCLYHLCEKDAAHLTYCFDCEKDLNDALKGMPSTSSPPRKMVTKSIASKQNIKPSNKKCTKCKAPRKTATIFCQGCNEPTCLSCRSDTDTQFCKSCVP
uniref:B box-type domain-containing protein n=1 Tax=Acrobeloides nanus TaxID=290746 RepID=A0A914CZP4_9BILA